MTNLSENSSESEGDGSDSEEVEDREAADEYYNPLEVEAQMKLLWKKEPLLLHACFGLALASSSVDSPPMCVDSDEKGYRMLFLRVLPIPPSRFRPPQKVGDIETEHAQNMHLANVLALSERIQDPDAAKSLGSVKNQSTR